MINRETRKSILALCLVTAMILSVVASPFVAITAVADPDDDDDEKGGTIVGGGSSADTAEQHPSQYNDEGPYSSDNTFETDNLPPVNNNYEDTAEGEVTDFSNLREADSSASLSPNDGSLSIGFGTYNIPDNNFYTMGIAYNVPSDATVYVTPVKPTGEAIDNSYELTGDGDAVSNIQLSETESQYLRNTGELYYVITSCNVDQDIEISETNLVSSVEEKDTKNYETRNGMDKNQLSCGFNAPPSEPTITINNEDGDNVNEVNEQLTFVGDATDPNGDELTYEWEINGQTYTGDTVPETFDSEGTYTATLTVSDGEYSESSTQQFNVEPNNDNTDNNNNDNNNDNTDNTNDNNSDNTDNTDNNNNDNNNDNTDNTNDNNSDNTDNTDNNNNDNTDVGNVDVPDVPTDDNNNPDDVVDTPDTQSGSDPMPDDVIVEPPVGDNVDTELCTSEGGQSQIVRDSGSGCELDGFNPDGTGETIDDGTTEIKVPPEDDSEHVNWIETQPDGTGDANSNTAAQIISCQETSDDTCGTSGMTDSGFGNNNPFGSDEDSGHGTAGIWDTN